MFLRLPKTSIFILAVMAVLVFSSVFVLAQTPEEEKKALEIELKTLEEQIAKYEKNMEGVQKEKKTLQNQISLLQNKIKKLNLQISQGNLMIKGIGIQVQGTEKEIGITSDKISETRLTLKESLRILYKESKKGNIEILLGSEQMSDFFTHLANLETLNSKINGSLTNIESLKISLEKEKRNLDTEKEDLGRVVKIQALQKQQNEEARKEQERILKMTEAQYQQYLKEKQELEKKAAEIMTRITQLTLPGLEVPRDKKELYTLASWAGNLTSVRPALILGLIEVESALGINVGQCNCAGQSVCRYPELDYKQVMRSNQWNSFEKIVKELGLNINTTPVSCSVAGGKVQWGGAMGPAQFMPNTWLNLDYKQKVENITGVRPANPWRARDAFLASALYLADWNANTQRLQSEMGAVTAYLCGTSTMTTTCSRAGGEWYRNLVMQKTSQWQKWIDEGVFNEK